MPQVSNKVERFKLHIKSQLERKKARIVPMSIGSLGQGLSFRTHLSGESANQLPRDEDGWVKWVTSRKKIIYNAELPDVDYEVESDYLQKIDQV